MNTIDVVIADDHAVVRTGYRRLLELGEGMRVVEEFGDADAAYDWLVRNRADVLILDLSMPGRGGLEMLQRLGVRVPALRTLVFSMHDSAAIVMQAMRAGAAGYLTKSSAPEALVNAVRTVAGGQQVLSDDIAGLLDTGRAAAAPSTVAAGIRPVPPVRARRHARGRRCVLLPQYQDGGQLPDADPQEDGTGQPCRDASLCGGAWFRLSTVHAGVKRSGRWRLFKSGADATQCCALTRFPIAQCGCNWPVLQESRLAWELPTACLLHGAVAHRWKPKRKRRRQ